MSKELTPSISTETDPGTEDVIQADSERTRLLAQLTQELPNEEERLATIERFSGLVDSVLRWAEQKGISVDEVRRLGGGFKNPVLMLTSPEGKSYVAKAFVEEDAVDTTKRAQALLDEIALEDEKFIPDSEFAEGSVLFSEKAEGDPVRGLLEDSIKTGECSDTSKKAFYSLGATLGMIHERTDRPVADTSEKEDLDATQVDINKIKNHFATLGIKTLLGISDEKIESVLANVGNITAPEFISLVHADAHLDQFFYAEGSMVEIVDYDDIREGDPMADVGRVLSSLRDWCGELDAPFDIESELTKQIILGYESTRTEDFDSSDGEMDYMRVVAYELRLRLVQLKQYTNLRKKLSDIASDIKSTESDVLLGTDESVVHIVEAQLSEQERPQFSRLRRLSKELNDIVTYLTPPETEQLAA